LLAVASRLLPPRLSPWALAMTRELDEIGDDRAALAFAAGCVRAILGLALAQRLNPTQSEASTWSILMNGILTRPRLLGLLCGAGAVALGLAHMSAAGAPERYMLMNLAALVLGATLWLALGRFAGARAAGAGALTLALAVPLLLTAWFGDAVDGAARWVSVGPFNLQLSLILLPAMLVLYARRPDATGTAGMMVAAVALALQPDRAMAGVLAASLLALFAANRTRLPAAATAAALLAFGWTLLQPDQLPAVLYVDGVLYTAFDVHPLAGLAVLAGAAALLLPAAGAMKPGADRPTLLTFAACWAGIVVAAALGNYPTPLVGYGGSAILGYLLSVALLPHRAGEGASLGTTLPTADDQSPDHAGSELRAPRLA
jgi:hypothetical protein